MDSSQRAREGRLVKQVARRLSKGANSEGNRERIERLKRVYSARDGGDEDRDYDTIFERGYIGGVSL